ncbi:MAG TPA: hypothetical protein VFE11_09855, partial [Dongiaceae bacterium]|nr:hypothetical protein [Dongiaceae bacterium]
AEFFADVRRCLTADGIAVMNAFASDPAAANYRSLVATVRSAFPALVAFSRPATGDELHLNTYLVAMAALRTPAPLRLAAVPEDLRDGLAAAFDNHVTIDAVERGLVVTDEHNIAAILNASEQMAFRRLLVQQLPPQMLVN